MDYMTITSASSIVSPLHLGRTGCAHAHYSSMSTDEVIPFRFLDENDVLQKLIIEFVMEFTYCFNDFLDSAKLKASLERVLQIGD